MWNVFISRYNFEGLCQFQLNRSGTAGECLKFLREHRHMKEPQYTFSIFKSSPFQNIYDSK